MKMALALLDRDRADHAACHLHRAIEIAETDGGIVDILSVDEAVTGNLDQPQR
ncbi:hypothetical protein [Sphingomonas faeni]|uniref:hypothetical protein n=1 Tax=Sphingomonas faeni TaxID=185950 RepID=UPI0020BD8F6E|nr:hypothetical protein [Sphingomonas faeni]